MNRDEGRKTRGSGHTFGITTARAAKRVVPPAISLALLLAVPLSAQSADDAQTIVRKTETNQVFDTAIIEAKLTVTGKFGKTDNEFTSWSRRGGDTLVEISSGPDRGQKVLRQGPNIYLYYPDADEVIWLKGSALKNSVMGSDFSYEDLTNDKTLLDRYSAALGGTEDVEGTQCWRITLTAKTRSETYAKQEIWVDKERYVTLRAIMYSASGKAMRDMVSTDVRNVSGKYLAFTTTMRDLLKKNSTTVMEIARAEINIPIADTYFNREQLSW